MFNPSQQYIYQIVGIYMKTYLKNYIYRHCKPGIVIRKFNAINAHTGAKYCESGLKTFEIPIPAQKTSGFLYSAALLATHLQPDVLLLLTYKDPSTIFGTGAAIWSETNFGPTGHHHTRTSIFPQICTDPSASAIF
jgi:hypothetical protein